MTEEAKQCVKALRFKEDFECIECPIPAGNCDENCMLDVAADLIESLSEQLDQVTRERDGLNIMLSQAQAMLETRTKERDAAIKDMHMTAVTLCNACARYHTGYPCGGGERNDEPCITMACTMFKWRGV